MTLNAFLDIDVAVPNPDELMGFWERHGMQDSLSLLTSAPTTTTVAADVRRLTWVAADALRRQEAVQPPDVGCYPAAYFNNSVTFPGSCVGGWQAVPVHT